MSGKVALFLIASFVSACTAASVAPGCECPRNYKPVCSSDGNTYSNECTLNCATIENPGLGIERMGPCS